MDSAAGIEVTVMDVVLVVGIVFLMNTAVLSVMLLLAHRFTRQLSSQQEDTLVLAQEIDKAVNSKAPGEMTISDRVDEIGDKQERDFPTTDAAPEGEGILPMTRRLVKQMEALTKRMDARDVLDAPKKPAPKRKAK